MLKELYRDDLIARNPGHTFGETVDGDTVVVEFKDAQSKVLARARSGNADQAYSSIREHMGIGPQVPALLTTAQRDALTDPENVGIIANTTTRALNVYIGGAWR